MGKLGTVADIHGYLCAAAGYRIAELHQPLHDFYAQTHARIRYTPGVWSRKRGCLCTDFCRELSAFRFGGVACVGMH